jgi:TetR/AcrR family transcriptional regulator
MNEILDKTGRVARRRTRTRARVLAAAERLYADRGLATTRVEDIAELADVSVGSIYTHFGNKDGIQAALTEQALEHLDGYLAAAFSASASPLEQVMAAGDAYLRFHLDHPSAARLLAAPSAGDAASSQGVSDATATLLGLFEERIAAAIAAGEAADLDAGLVARFLWGAWNGVAALGLRRDELAMTPDQIAACLQQGRRIVLDGLCAPNNRDTDGKARARLLEVVRQENATTTPTGVSESLTQLPNRR